MKIYELKVKVILLKDIPYLEQNNEIGKVVDNALGKTIEMTEYHKRNAYKNYCFDGFYPMEIPSKIYQQGKVYFFKLRTIDLGLLQHLKEYLILSDSEKVKVINYHVSELKTEYIHKIRTLTPVIVRNQNKYWRKTLNTLEFQERIFINLIKKRNAFEGNQLDEDFKFLTSINFINRKPIKCPMKNVNYLADKVEIEIGHNESAQILAKYALGCGIGELNSRGYGFCYPEKI